MKNPAAWLLIAVGIFLEAIRIGPDWVNTNWLGGALIVLGAVWLVVDLVTSRI